MPTALAAYCSACRAYVLVGADGGCEYGHARPNLRGLYTAQLERRTGRPLPPSPGSAGVRVSPPPPVAPIADPPAARPVQSLPEAVGPAAPAGTGAGATVRETIRAAWLREAVSTDAREILDRLFGPPRGKHSSATRRLLPEPRGRHSAGRVNRVA